ncbi:peroxidase [Trifolium repens]|nr:peroxidase [Trifolium repens]
MNSIATSLLCVVLLVLLGLPLSSNAQLSPTFYSKTCPNVSSIVSNVLTNVSKTDPRMLASLVRLHFHDCFVQGCDASRFGCCESNQNSSGKSLSKHSFLCRYSYTCCSSILCSAQGPGWTVPLGRRDSLTANQSLANQNLPAPFDALDKLKSAFAAQGLNTTDLVALSGAHTFGRAHCSLFVSRLYNFSSTGSPDPTLNTTYLQQLRTICPNGGPGTNLTNFDPTTPDKFDKNYYSNLQVKKGLLQSDQELFSTSGADTITIVNKFSSDQNAFFESFKAAMIKMGNIGVLTGTKGEIRKQCNFVNSKSAELGLATMTQESSEDDLVSSI